MRVRQRNLLILAVLTVLSCGRSSSPAPHPDAVARALAAKPHRLAVIFLPEVAGCTSCDQMISAVISDWQSDPHAGLAVVSVIPDRTQENSPWLPGAIVRLTAEEYKRYKGSAPLPRVQLWSAEGALLLSRSVPNNGIQAELLTEEMLAARSFTAPVKVTTRSHKAR